MPVPNIKKSNNFSVAISAGFSISAYVQPASDHVFATILWSATVTNLSIPQAREYMDAMLKCVNWAESQGAKKGDRGKPGIQVFFKDENPNLIVRRALMMSDDTLFVVVKRRSLGFGMKTKPQIAIEEWEISENGEPFIKREPRMIPRDPASTAQAARSIGQAIEDAVAWR